MAEGWEGRFKRAVAKYAGVPDDVELENINVEFAGDEGYSFSSMTYADSSISLTVEWPNGYKSITGPEEIAKLIQSFILGV